MFLAFEWSPAILASVVEWAVVRLREWEKTASVGQTGQASAANLADSARQATSLFPSQDQGGDAVTSRRKELLHVYVFVRAE